MKRLHNSPPFVGETLYRDLSCMKLRRPVSMKQSLLICLLLLTLPIASALEFSGQAVNVDAWAKPTVSADAPGLVYFQLANEGTRDDHLLRVNVGAEIAAASTLRRIDRTAGQVKVRYLAKGLAVPARAPIQPGYYVMLSGLTEALTEGRRFPVTMVFEHAGEVEVEVVVEAPLMATVQPVALSHKRHGG